MYPKNLNHLLKARFSSKSNPFNNIRKTLNVKGTSYNYYSLPDLQKSSFSNYQSIISHFIFKKFR